MIRYKNYRIEPTNGRFDLVKEKTIEERVDPKTKQVIPAHKSEEVMAYSISFEYCLTLIVTDLIEEREGIDTIQGYINAYKAEKNELLNILE